MKPGSMSAFRESAELPDDDRESYDPRGFAIQHFIDGHDGPGWYYWDSEYPEEGSCGAFETREEAVAHAASAYADTNPED